MRRAGAISDRVYAELAEQPFVGRTEAELAWWLEQAWHEAGADGPSFDAIVAFGENGARPHAKLRDVPIPEGTLVVVDAGCSVDGYAPTAPAPSSPASPTGGCARSTTSACRRSSTGSRRSGPARSGATSTRPRASRSRRPGSASSYGHGLGHGVGLDVHEEPSLRPESESVLEAGNVVTVEPGIYLAGDVGVRIEDMVVVTEDGCERLTTVTKEPVVVG